MNRTERRMAGIAESQSEFQRAEYDRVVRKKCEDELVALIELIRARRRIATLERRLARVLRCAYDGGVDGYRVVSGRGTIQAKYGPRGRVWSKRRSGGSRDTGGGR